MHLYETDPYCKEFQSKVLSCTQTEEDFIIVLEQTAFYPEGGGQPWDTGFLNSVEVRKVQKNEDNIFHHCSAEIPVGECVTGKIHWQRRFDLMQQHSGEHILSGLAHQFYGCENVGFHMGKERITIDFDKELSKEQLSHLETKANEYIWENHPCVVTYPNEAERNELHYRSKKELSGSVRIVSFPDADCCACCGTHVAFSGEVGLILLLSSQKFRDGVRIELLCGERAFQYLKDIHTENQEISKLLSAKPLETAQSVARLQKEKENADYQRKELEKKYISLLVQNHKTENTNILFLEDLSPDSLRLLATKLAASNTNLVACFSQNEAQFSFALASTSQNMTELVKQMKENFTVRGGGKPNLVQGTIQNTTKEALETFFASIL